MLEAFARFARELPAWCGADGFPLSWRHFRYGLAHIDRANAADELRTASSARIAQYAPGDEYVKYLSDLRAAAGMTRR